MQGKLLKLTYFMKGVNTEKYSQQYMFDQQPEKSLLPSYYTTSKTKPKADKTMC
jgi:hypothetical protein